MNTKMTVNAVLLLAVFAASGCATVDRSGLSFNEGKKAAEEEGRRVCSAVAPVGSHMKRIVCRSPEVVDATSDRAKDALRDRAVRTQLPRESGGR